MIEYNSNKQIKIEEFSTPFEMKMDAENRWVKLSKAIPWDELAMIYHRSLSQDKGAKAKDARLVIGAIIIKYKLQLDDRGVIEMIREHPYMQYFCGLSSFTSEPIFDPSLFVTIRKRLGNEAFDQMNQEIIGKALGIKRPSEKKRDKDDGSSDKPNKGKLQIDATVADADIKFPTDVDLLNDSRVKSEEMIDELYSKLALKQKPRTYRNQARKKFLNFSKKKNRTKKEVRQAIKVQLGYLNRNIKTIDKLLDNFEGKAFPLDKKLQKYLFVIQHVYQQQLEMYKQSKHSCEDRIVSIHQPHVRPIVRGKSGKNVEFGAKIDLNLQQGFARINRFSWDAFNEGTDLIDCIKEYKRVNGCYPELMQVDKIYLTKENRKFMKENRIRHIGKPLGRPAKQEQQTAYQRRKKRKESAERNHVEGTFGTGKRKYRLDEILAKTARTAESWIAAIIFVMNLTKMMSYFLLNFILMIFCSLFPFQVYKNNLHQNLLYPRLT